MNRGPGEIARGAVVGAVTACLAGDIQACDFLLREAESSLPPEVWGNAYTNALYAIIGWLLASLAAERGVTRPEAWQQEALALAATDPEWIPYRAGAERNAPTGEN